MKNYGDWDESAAAAATEGVTVSPATSPSMPSTAADRSASLPDGAWGVDGRKGLPGDEYSVDIGFMKRVAFTIPCSTA